MSTSFTYTVDDLTFDFQTGDYTPVEVSWVANSAGSGLVRGEAVGMPTLGSALDGGVFARWDIVL